MFCVFPSYRSHLSTSTHMRLPVDGSWSSSSTPYIFHIHMCRQNAPVFDDFSLAGHLKSGHLFSICPKNSQAIQIIIDK